MQKALVIFSFFILLVSTITINEKVEWLKQNAVPISIDPTNEDFKDLQPLKKIISDAEMVLLGEQTHGDGATFEAKCRLVKFLHQHMNFDVLAFESGFFICDKANYEIHRKGIDPYTAFQNSLNPVWSYAKQLETLQTYISKTRKTNDPLEICGFDPQNGYAGLRKKGYQHEIVFDFERFVKKKNIYIDTNDMRLFRYAFFHDRNTDTFTNDTLDMFLTTSDNIVSKIKDDDYESEFWKHCLHMNLFYLNKYIKLKNSKIEYKSFNSNTLRDSLMAENLIWLKKHKYPHKKIIVWAATFHNIRKGYNIMDARTGKINSAVVTFGDILSRRFETDKVYNMGFSAAQGVCAQAGSSKLNTLSPIIEGSFEDLAIKAGLENAVIDFKKIRKSPKNHWLKDSLTMRLLGSGYQKAVWTEHLDGICFTKNMKRVDLDMR